MKRNLKLALLLLPVGAFAVGLVAQALLCYKCRDPAVFPRDYGNQLFNYSFGVNSDPELVKHLRYGGVVEVKQIGGPSAIVSMKYKIQKYSVEVFGFGLASLTVPTDLLEVIVQTPDGAQHPYTIFAKSGELLVGSPEPSKTPIYGATIDVSGILTHGDNGTANRGGVLIPPGSYSGSSDFGGFGSDPFGISGAMDALFGEPLASVWSEGNAFANLSDDWLDEMIMATASQYAANNLM